MKKLRPESASDAASAVRSHPRVAAVGGGSKWRDPQWEGSLLLEMSGLSGITEYAASEYTFTALAGTPVREVRQALAEMGQQMPFDPCFVEAGATLGGTVASGLSGPGRFRYGGLRDFLLGVEFVDGTGQLVRAGGKVVKNAAGFDLPKFMVGSLGCFGILTEVSFKVFPLPAASMTLRVGCGNPGEAVRRLAAIAAGRWEAEAIEFSPADMALHVRLGGPPAALDALAAELGREWVGEVELVEGGGYWEGLREFRWVPAGRELAKVPVTPSRIPALEEALAEVEGCARHYSSGGAVAWLAMEVSARQVVDDALKQLGLRGMLLQAPAGGRRWLGVESRDAITGAMKSALDPENRFPAL